ncbi:unnamed protein product, partial [marine sediment metagenome]
MQKINPKKILFIKLGAGGKWEKECIEESQTIRIEYDEVNHNSCLKGEWEDVYNSFINIPETRDFVASSHTNQV